MDKLKVAVIGCGNSSVRYAVKAYNDYKQIA